MNSTAVDFGNRVRSQREYLQFSQSAFAHKIGKTQAYVSLVENGKYYPDSDMREKMSEVLNVSVKYLLGEESQVSITKPTEVTVYSPFDPDEDHRIYGNIPGFFNHRIYGNIPGFKFDDAPDTKTQELIDHSLISESPKKDENHHVLGYLPFVGAEGAPESSKKDDVPDDPDCKKVLDLVQKNLDHLFKVTGDQFFVSPKTSLYSISEICKHYKISVSYLFEDHEKEWLKEEIENKYKEIEQMESKLSTLEKND